ncbi:enhanced level of genomic instability 1 [Halyomorpha halys]|uniref:enhanced level of genomic instability 1 n=1 Tax=Halyomorpha halys TaxID=286706 RepID=UPI0006D4ED49|nr:replication factor C subunit 1 [Halyomorpha halys]
MKDLKHYFVSPKGDIKNEESGIVTNNSSSRRESVSRKLNAVKDITSNGIATGHSKKKKRKRVESGDFDEKSADIENVASTPKENKVSKDIGKKKKTDVLKRSNKKNLPEELTDTVIEVSNSTPDLSKKKKLVETDSFKKSKTRRKSDRNIKPDEQSSSFLDDSYKEEKLVGNVNLKDSRSDKKALKSERSKRDSNSSKENSVCNSETEDKDSPIPDNSKSLFNYFSKIDKLPEIEERPRIIKVEAMVHVPSGGSAKSTPTSLKKRKSSKKKDLKIDYDLITLEGTESIEVDDSTGPVQNVRQMEDNSVLSHKSNVVECIDISEPTIEEAQKVSFDDQVEIVKERKKRKLETEQLEDKVSKKKPAIAESDVIFVKEITKEKPKVKSDGTLASFFQIGRKTSSLSSVQKLAKKQFLNSGTPESIKRIAVTLSNAQGKEAPFPDKSHVLQKDRMNIVWNLFPIKHNFRDDKEALNNPVWSSILPSPLKSTKKLSCEVQSSYSTSSKENLKELKKELNLYPITCWHKELKRLRKGKESSMWTEKYRPHLSSTFLANTRNISKLKGWLAELKENSYADSCESSSDEFVKDNEKDSVDRKTVALLSGPPGTGKTAAVYATAEEIGYHVLEINASYNRSGKRIFNEFSEAMQSHKVGVSKLNFSKVKKKTEDPKRSLILIEDADLLFEDDEGFVPTLINLAAGTKRPIILIVNNTQVKHLSKLYNLCHASLHFTPPSQDRLGSWLRTVSVVEGFNLSSTKAAELACSQDIRRSLLQLQLSHGKISSRKSGELEESIWEEVGEFNLSSIKERKKAKRYSSSLATLDIIRQNEKNTGFDKPYWHSYPGDSTLTRECKESPGGSFLDDYESYFLALVNVKPASKKFQPPECPRMLNEIEKTAFNMTNILSRRNNALDYWPTFRQISRNEAHRLASHTKRNNRYFNYLSSVGIAGPPDFIQTLPTTFACLP